MRITIEIDFDALHGDTAADKLADAEARLRDAITPIYADPSKIAPHHAFPVRNRDGARVGWIMFESDVMGAE